MVQAISVLGTKVNIYGCWYQPCGALVALSADTESQRVFDGGTFYCSAGHAIRFGESETQRALNNEKARAQAEAQRLQGIVQQERRIREEAERRAADAERDRLKAEREKNATKRILKNAVKTSAKLVSTKGRDRGRSHKKRVE